MKEKDKKILFVLVGGHEMHEKIAKTIGDSFDLRTSEDIPKNYDVYLFEGSYIKPILLKKSGKIKKDSKIITLFPDPRLFYLGKRKRYDLKKKKMKNLSLFRWHLSKKLIKQIDGALCMGKFLGGLFRRYNKKSPLKIVYGFISEKKNGQLIKIKPNLSNHNLLFIGDGPDPYCKGLDFLIETFKIVKKKVPDARLDVLGRRWDIKKAWRTEGVFFHGRKDIVPYLKKSSLCLHLGRGEGFGLNVVESMLAGVPVIVSEYTGAKEVVEKANKDFVVSMNKGEIVEKILNWFDLDLKRKKEISKKGRIPAKEFKEEKMLKYFKKQLDSLVEEIYKD